LKFSIKKKINNDKNNNDKKLPDNSLNIDSFNEKVSAETNKELEGEKGEKIDNKNNVIDENDYLENKSNFNAKINLPINEDSKSIGKVNEVEVEDICNRCKEKIADEWKHPHWKWNLDKNLKFCIKCYKIKEKEYEKLINYCAICDSKLKFIRYNPKSEWKIKGQLCRKCWDNKNAEFKSYN
jgi:hypothetical protein